MSCERTLKWYELLPFFSFVFLRRRCRTCRDTDMPDPFPLAALLRLAVERDGRGTSAIARDAGLQPQAVSRALRDSRETPPRVARAILRACGAAIVLLEK